MKLKQLIIGENTLIPVSLVVIILGGALYIQRLDSMIQANTQQISEIKEFIKVNQVRVDSLDNKINVLTHNVGEVSGKIDVLISRKR
jgi:peptidoglycan hydrolase CwlO-like protein